MKKTTKGCLAGMAIPVLLVVGLKMACAVARRLPTNPVKSASALLEIGLPPGTVPVTMDDSGPRCFPADRHMWIVLQIPPDKTTDFSQRISASHLWKRLPLPPELAVAESGLQPPPNRIVNGHIPLETAKGFYLFVDREVEKHPNRNREDVAKPFFERGSLDFIFGVFDESTGMIYIWSIST